ncbi:MAG: DUF2934 domain-containing protein [Nitrospirota bacterium]|nr:DUF2934 domain-containing protein [Nitrospirota bacterium]
MKSVSIRSTTPKKNAPAPQQQQIANKPAAQKFQVLPLSPCDDLPSSIAKRAYELYSERGYRDGSALEDWLEAEREILSQVQSA